ncbi:MAG: HAMP domain-containing sensor histidine kinase [Bacteroidota bacterium]
MKPFNHPVLLTLFSYKTPLQFIGEFKKFYTTANLKQVKALSMTIFIITILIRLIGLIFKEKTVLIINYDEHSLGNWVQMGGALVFYLLSRWALNKRNLNYKIGKTITLLFVIYVLLITLGVSYVVSQHNTKNTLTMFLIGIVTVSLFFSLEYKEIIAISTFIVFVFYFSMVLPKPTFQDQMLNLVASIVLGSILISFSRYSYYFKSQHFVRLKMLEEKTIEIEKLNTQKNEILAFVAHDLRGPINNIEFLSQLLTAEEKAKEEVEMINASAKQAKEIINDLVQAVSPDEPVLNTETVEISAYLDNFIKKWRMNTIREISFKKLDKGLVKINSSKIERVLDNLITNALKFSVDDKPIEVDLLPHGENICIVVKDFGIGIPKPLQKHVFNKFSTSGRKGLKGEKSLGLGLHISKKIVEQHGGKLLMKSKENEGTAFTILLPIV